MTYRIDPKRCVAVHVNEVAARPGAAPRHIDFHPTKALAYVINELDSTLTTYRQDRKSGQLTPIQRIPVDAVGFHRLQHRRRDLGRSRRPQRLRLQPRPRQHRRVRHRSGQGHARRRASGCRPRAACRASSAFDPRQRFLYVANQGGHSILGYKVERDGKLSPTRIRVKVPSPACIVFSGAYLMSKTYGFETLSIHAGAGPDPATGARALPIYQTTAYAFDDADHAAALFNLQTVGFIYSRLTNPTNAALETRLATLEGGRGCTVTVVGPCGAGAGPLPADAAGRRDRRLLPPLRRLAAADEEHLSEVRLEGAHRRRRHAGQLQARAHRQRPRPSSSRASPIPAA